MKLVKAKVVELPRKYKEKGHKFGANWKVYLEAHRERADDRKNSLTYWLFYPYLGMVLFNFVWGLFAYFGLISDGGCNLLVLNALPVAALVACIPLLFWIHFGWVGGSISVECGDSSIKMCGCVDEVVYTVDERRDLVARTYKFVKNAWRNFKVVWGIIVFVEGPRHNSWMKSYCSEGSSSLSYLCFFFPELAFHFILCAVSCHYLFLEWWSFTCVCPITIIRPKLQMRKLYGTHVEDFPVDTKKIDNWLGLKLSLTDSNAPLLGRR